MLWCQLTIMLRKIDASWILIALWIKSIITLKWLSLMMHQLIQLTLWLASIWRVSLPKRKPKFSSRKIQKIKKLCTTFIGLHITFALINLSWRSLMEMISWLVITFSNSSMQSTIARKYGWFTPISYFNSGILDCPKIIQMKSKKKEPFEVYLLNWVINTLSIRNYSEKSRRKI